MKRCIIITAYNPGGFPGQVRLTPQDYIVCADGGFLLTKEMGIRPDVIIGDFDSAIRGKSAGNPASDPFFEQVQIHRVPAEKDDTDTMLCVKYAMEKDFSDFLLIGGIGGRLDHTFANLQCLAWLADHGKNAALVAPDNMAFLRDPQTVRIPRTPGFKFSLIPWTKTCAGVTIRGAKYPLTDFLLENNMPLAVSNEFEQDTAVVSFSEGRMLFILSRDSAATGVL